jgi:hypothetical protein
MDEIGQLQCSMNFDCQTASVQVYFLCSIATENLTNVKVTSNTTVSFTLFITSLMWLEAFHLLQR